MRSLRLEYSFTIAMLIVCLVGVLQPIKAFSTWKFSSRRSSTCTFAVFVDDDCEDLCGAFAFGDDSMAATPNKLVEDFAKISNTPQRAPRRSRALWWPDAEPDKCSSCEGTGEMTCRFCGGTSMMSAIGGDTDALFIEGIGNDCPICNDGAEACHKCAGTGFVFSWSKARNRTDSLQP